MKKRFIQPLLRQQSFYPTSKQFVNINYFTIHIFFIVNNCHFLFLISHFSHFLSLLHHFVRELSLYS